MKWLPGRNISPLVRLVSPYPYIFVLQEQPGVTCALCSEPRYSGMLAGFHGSRVDTVVAVALISLACSDFSSDTSTIASRERAVKAVTPTLLQRTMTSALPPGGTGIS